MRSVFFHSTVTISLLVFSAGCASYKAQPLGQREALDEPRSIDTDVRVAAASFKQPRLQPVLIDLNKGLSPEEAGVVAVLIHPELRAARDQRAEASAQLFQAGLLPNPQISATLDFPQGADRADSFTAYGLGFDYDFTALISRDAKMQAAAATAQSINLTVAWKEWQFAEAAKLAAYDLQALQQQVMLAREEDEALAKNAGAVRSAYEAHDKTLVDLTAADASAAEAHAVSLSLEKELQHARHSLNRALGLAPEVVIKLRSGLVSNDTPSPSGSGLVGSLAESRLDLAALRSGYDSQEATLRAAVLSQFPKISCGLNAARDTSNIKTIGLGLNIELPLFDHNQGVIAEETATRQRLYDEYSQRLFEARADVAAAIADLRAIDDQIAGDEASLPALQLASDAFRESSDRGDTDVLSAYSARSALVQKRLDVLKLKQDRTDTWIALELACGRLLPTTQVSSEPAVSLMSGSRDETR